jgi:RimJ/RimL family protein N-acetyltransferase
MKGKYRPRRIVLRDGRTLTLRAIAEGDATEIVQAGSVCHPNRATSLLVIHKRHLGATYVPRRIRSGRDFVFVATIPAADGIDIVGAAQYVQAGDADVKTCEFAVTVAEDWRGSGLATELLSSLVRQARRDGYQTMEGFVIAENTAMLALSRRLKFKAEHVAGDATVLRVQLAL